MLAGAKLGAASTTSSAPLLDEGEQILCPWRPLLDAKLIARRLAGGKVSASAPARARARALARLAEQAVAESQAADIFGALRAGLVQAQAGTPILFCRLNEQGKVLVVVECSSFQVLSHGIAVYVFCILLFD